ncbi:MAG: alcohol dehydrogenase [Magnetovibrio sp.]|nr:alcohol dehydrogenase [Magnetovibrio sp.]
MKSYRITEYGAPLAGQDDATPVPEGGEVLIEVAGCGVCHSDVHIWEGYFDMGGGRKADLSRAHQLPFTLGHEIAGTVAAVGHGATATLGEQVVVYPWIGCGACDVCRAGDENLCAQPRNLGVHLNGGYATHVVVPDARYLFPVGDAPLELAATYACSGITAFGALKKVRAKAEGRQLLIIGAGGVGLAGLMIASAMMETEIIVADIDPAKREAALAAGAAHAVDPADKEARKQIVKLTGGGAPAAVDFVGADKTVAFGFGALATAGQLVVVGLFGGAVELSVPLFPLKSLTVMGSYVGTPKEMGELMDLVATGKVAPLPIATRPLAEAGQTLADLAAGKIVGRVVLTPEGG